MKIVANGKTYEVAEGLSLTAFLESIGQRPGMVVVERNKEALAPSEARAATLADGDRLEIVRIVAGG